MSGVLIIEASAYSINDGHHQLNEPDANVTHVKPKVVQTKLRLKMEAIRVLRPARQA